MPFPSPTTLQLTFTALVIGPTVNTLNVPVGKP